MSEGPPDPRALYPITLPDGSPHTGTVFLRNAIDHPNIEIGAFTYYSDFGTVTDHAARLAPYLFPGSAERLIIGSYCQLAHGTRFVTASANHPMDGFSTFPFAVFNPASMGEYAGLALRWGDTVVGNDVWCGYRVTILPGVTIGDGAIVGARAVVARDVPPYAVVAGNPARVVRMRFDDATIARLQALRWWDWPPETVWHHRAAIAGADIGALEAVAPKS